MEGLLSILEVIVFTTIGMTAAYLLVTWIASFRNKR